MLGKKLISLLTVAALCWVVAVQAGQPYRLGAGDIVQVSVYGQSDLDTLARIAESGRITFPLIGEVALSGLTEREAELKVASLLRDRDIVKSPQVSLIVDSYQSRRVSVLGEVREPGVYSISRGSSVVDLIAEAGGLGENAGSKAIVTHTENGVEHKTAIDLNGILRGDMAGQDLQVTDGDRIYVPIAERFYVYGQVNRPGVYPLENGMTVMQALSVAGGLTDKGTERGLTINRQEKPKTDNAPISIAASLTQRVQPGDVLHVKESLF